MCSMNSKVINRSINQFDFLTWLMGKVIVWRLSIVVPWRSMNPRFVFGDRIPRCTRVVAPLSAVIACVSD